MVGSSSSPSLMACLPVSLSPANPEGIGNNSLRLPNLGEAAYYVASLRPTLSQPNSFFNLRHRVFTPVTRWMILG